MLWIEAHGASDGCFVGVLRVFHVEHVRLCYPHKHTTGTIGLMNSYPVGWPFWKIAARAGVAVRIHVHVIRDEEAGVYVACNSNLKGLVAEAPTLDELRTHIDAAAEDLLLHYLHQAPVRHPVTQLTLDGGLPA